MQNYQEVNDEIQNFLQNNKGGNTKNTDNFNLNSFEKLNNTQNKIQNKNLEFTLERLQNLYDEINTHLKYDNEQGLKNVLLANDIKMNLVNESLLNTLKTAVADKNKLLEENNNLNKEKLDLEQKYNKSKFYGQKLEGDMEYKTANVAELNRIIQDQKKKLGELNLSLEKQKNEARRKENEAKDLQTKIERQTERYSAYDKEMEILNTLATEREEALKKMLNEKRDEENKNSTVKIRLAEAERNLEQIKQKLEIKDKNLLMCNAELSKLLVENKKLKNDFEKFKSNSDYYEDINKNLNGQNTYLNKQLTKIIQSEKYVKEGLDVMDVFEDKKKAYKKKIKKYKNLSKKYEDENEELKNKLEDNAYKVTSADDTVLLHDKIETLAKANKEYKEKLVKMEMEKKTKKEKEEISTSMLVNDSNNHNNFNNNSKFGFKNRFNLNEKIAKVKEELNRPITINSKRNIFDMESLRLNLDKQKETKNNYDDYQNQYKYRTAFDRYKNQFNAEPKKEESYVKPAYFYEPTDLINKYDTKKKSSYMGGFDDSLNSLIYQDKKEKSFTDEGEELKKYFDEYRRQKISEGDKKKLVEKVAAFDATPKNVKSFTNTNNIFDSPSTESVKSFQTSATLKEMMERTNKLQQKFENLDQNLNNLNTKKQYKDINVDLEDIL